MVCEQCGPTFLWQSHKTHSTYSIIWYNMHFFFVSLYLWVSIIKILNFCKMLHKNKCVRTASDVGGVVSTMATMQCIAFKMSICVYVWTGFDIYIYIYDTYIHTHVAWLCNLIDHNIDQVYMKSTTHHSHIRVLNRPGLEAFVPGVPRTPKCSGLEKT